MDTHRRSLVARWAAGAALLGMVFPLVGIAVGRWHTGGFDLLDIHSAQPVLWALDLAPVVFAGIGALIGAAHTHLSELRAKTDSIAERMAEELSTEIHDHNVELARSADLQAKYFAALSHDMRTPLSAIIGFAAAPLDDPNRADVRTVLTYMEEIGVAARQLLEIVNDLLDTAKLGSGKIELSLGSVDGDEVAIGVVRHLTPLAEEEGLLLFTDLQAGVECRADGMRLRQILVNLVSNALKYTDEGSVIVRSYRDGERLVYEVEDTGAGIAAEDFPRLFRPFEQTSAGKSRLDSTGLGLPVSLGLAQAMGGSIEVISDGIGKGSIFRLVLLPGDGSDVEELCLATLPALAA